MDRLNRNEKGLQRLVIDKEQLQKKWSQIMKMRNKKLKNTEN